MHVHLSDANKGYLLTYIHACLSDTNKGYLLTYNSTSVVMHSLHVQCPA